MLNVAFNDFWDLGIHYYLLNFEYRGVVPQYLYDMLQVARDEGFPDDPPFNVTTAFQSWELQAGNTLHPLLGLRSY